MIKRYLWWWPDWLTMITDITEPHLLSRALFKTYTTSPSLSTSPLTQWTSLFLTSTYNKILSLDSSLDPTTIGLQLHDPLTIWYALCPNDPLWKFTKDEDIRVETLGQWTRGCCIVDTRGRSVQEGTESLDEEAIGDAGGWRDTRRGNRMERCTGSPGVDLFAGVLLERVLGKI